MTDYDKSRLQQLGHRHRRLRAQLDEVKAELAPEILAADDAGVPQVEIVGMTGYTREAIRKLLIKLRSQGSRA